MTEGGDEDFERFQKKIKKLEGSDRFSSPSSCQMAQSQRVRSSHDYLIERGHSSLKGSRHEIGTDIL